MSGTLCPHCGQKADGNFCASCRGALGGRHCTECGASTETGARFCNACGHSLGSPVGGGAAGAGGSSKVGWWAAGVALLIVMVTFAYPVLRGGTEEGGVTGGAPPRPPDLSTMTPREAADRLFTRVMEAVSAGDTQGAAQFLPMAVAAYERARPLDADGFFHTALLLQTGGDYEAALANVEQCLELSPGHLLCLSAAGSSAAELGREELARQYFGELLEGWDRELATGVEEYEAHANMLPGIREEAEAYAGG